MSETYRYTLDDGTIVTVTITFGEADTFSRLTSAIATEFEGVTVRIPARRSAADR